MLLIGEVSRTRWRPTLLKAVEDSAKRLTKGKKACREKSAEVIVCPVTSLPKCDGKGRRPHKGRRTEPSRSVQPMKDYRMKERMQKMPTQSGSCPQQSRPEAKGTVGVQTFMRVVDGCLTAE